MIFVQKSFQITYPNNYTNKVEHIGEECPPHAFLCANNQCIPFSKVCDEKPDCRDNSDETTICSGNLFVLLICTGFGVSTSYECHLILLHMFNKINTINSICKKSRYLSTGHLWLLKWELHYRVKIFRNQKYRILKAP